jgi:hypothetical protein
VETKKKIMETKKKKQLKTSASLASHPHPQPFLGAFFFNPSHFSVHSFTNGKKVETKKE